MSDNQADKKSVNTTVGEGSSNDKLFVEDSEADKLSRDWTARLTCLSENHLSQPSDILVAILFLIFTDNDFIPAYNQESLDDGMSYNKNSFKLPSDWKTSSPGSHCFIFTLPECYDFSCRFVAVVLGELLLVNAICSYPEVVNSVCLNICEYVEYKNSTLNIKEPRKLLFKAKDSIVTPSRNAAFSYRGIPHASLTGLPKEILEYVLVLCGPMAVCNLMRTSRLLRMLGRDQLVWHTFYLQEFEQFISNSVDDDAHDWYERFKNAYLGKLDVERKCFRFAKGRDRYL